MISAKRRLQQLQNILSDGGPKWSHLLVLPDGARVAEAVLPGGSTAIAIDGKSVLTYRTLSNTARLVLSALGTPYEDENPTPSYAALELSIPDSDGQDMEAEAISIPDLWAAIYALWTKLHEQEYIPVAFAQGTKGLSSIEEYLLLSGLARRSLAASSGTSSLTPSKSSTRTPDYIFLVRATFWQGAGTGPQWSNPRSWLRPPYGPRAASFPSTQSFTRTSLVIAAHPLRAPKPAPGTCVYRRFCAPVGQVLDFTAIDPHSEAHMAAFHRWMNDKLVNKGWGEKGSLEEHRRYVEKAWADPHLLPMMMSWDGELMGYCEIVWIRENHVATFIPEGPLDHDRGLHVLVGEQKFRGQRYGQAWFRSVTHYIFLADPRTLRVVGEPKRNNPAIIKMSIDAGMHLQTSFYFPYKHSVMTMNLRERFFKEDMLT